MKYKKLGAGLLDAVDDFEAEGDVGLTPHRRALGVIEGTGAKSARMVVFLHCEEKAKLEALEGEGVVINQKHGKVRTAIVALDQIGELSDHRAIKRIEPARFLKPLMDVAPGKVKVPAFKSSSGLTGDGVVVGVVDSGIDPKHPDFAGRIERVWDQTLSGNGVSEGAYGLELSGSLLTTSRDTHGHGTHVAGIAAGAGAVFGGIAPAARLVVVKTDFQDAHIADGVRYIFRVARELGRPAVVNLSLGGHADAHDGTDSLSQIIDEECGPGRIVCCAAGNEGNDNIHAQVALGAPATRTSRFQIPTRTLRTVWLNGWYPGRARLEVSIRTPRGFTTPFQGVLTNGSFRRVHNLADAVVTIETPGPDPANNDINFWVMIRGLNRGPIVGGTWELRVRNTAAAPGRLDVWLLDDEDQPTAIFTGASASDSMKIGSPGSANSALTVASFTTKTAWTDVDGVSRSLGFPLDTISDFSSEGPLRNNARKPDVTAPGAVLVSCLSRDSSGERPFQIDSLYRGMMGTSMATPFMTGLTALLLQRDPTLDPTAAKTLIRRNSRVPGSAAGAFDPKWGFGLIDASGL